MTADRTAPGGCPETGDRDLAAAYVAGRLDEPEAEAFEAHWFQCDACWSRVKRAAEVRAAFRGVEEGGRPPGAADEGPEGSGRPGAETTGDGPPDPGPFRRGRWWLPVAAAAALVGIAFGVGDLARESSPGPDGPVYRGAGERVDLRRAELGTRGVEIDWAPVSAADLYRVRLYDAEGRLLEEEESADTSIVLAHPTVEGLPRSADFYVQVEALDELREVIGRSAVEVGGGAPDGGPEGAPPP